MAATNNSSLAAGTVLDSGEAKYRIVSVLGRGGFGITYLALAEIMVGHVPTEAKFAIKEHFPSAFAHREGCDVVYGVRNSRETDTAFKRSTAQGFYKVMHLLGAEVVYNHADYRLMSRRALQALSEYKEVNLFLRGIVPLIGFRSDYVY